MTRTCPTIVLLLLLIATGAFATAEGPAALPPDGPDKSAVVVEPETANADDVLQRRFRYFSIRDLTLEQAVEMIRAATHANFVVETWRLEEAGFDPKRKVRLYLEDITFEHAFDAMLATYGRDVQIEVGQRNGNVLVISTPEGARGTVTRIYDVRMMVELARSADRGRPLGPRVEEVDEDYQRTREEIIEEVVKLLQETIDPDSWRDNGGSEGAVRQMSCRLLITHTPAAQKQIEKFLKDLEQELSRPMPPSPATQPATTPHAAQEPKS